MILQNFTTVTKPTSLLYSTNTHKILGLKGKRQVSSVQSADRGSLVTVVSCVSPTGHFIPSSLVFPRKCIKLEMTSGTPPAPSQACHHPLGVNTERDFHPVVSSFHQTYKADKRRSCYLNFKLSHPRCVYINNRFGYQSITQQYLKKMFNTGRNKLQVSA